MKNIWNFCNRKAWISPWQRCDLENSLAEQKIKKLPEQRFVVAIAAPTADSVLLAHIVKFYTALVCSCSFFQNCLLNAL